VAGVVQARLAATGDAVQPGSPIATVIDRSEVLLRFHVPLADAPLVAPGQVVAFRTPADAADRGARIRLVGETADPASRQVPVLAVVDDPAGVRPGAFASVRCELPPGPARVLVPDLAVRPSERGWLVWLAVDGKAREQRVQVGSRTRDGRIEVLAGLAPGQQVVVRGGDALRDGVTLAIARPEP
jgi:multidrug efflux system membrane fusion protein